LSPCWWAYHIDITAVLSYPLDVHILNNVACEQLATDEPLACSEILPLDGQGWLSKPPEVGYKWSLNFKFNIPATSFY
jgi:hypothetical protein